VKKLYEYCVYTIKHPQKLIEASRDKTPLHEAKRWVVGAKLLKEAHDSRCELPILFADARECSRLIAWSVLRSIDVSPTGTQYAIGPLYGLPKAKPQDLILQGSGERIKADFIRPYALCQTPAFLCREADSPQPWSDRSIVEAEAREGRRLVRIHESRERTPGLVKQLKDKYRASNNGRLPCQVCGFDFLETYGDVGAGFAEAHHMVPLAEAPKRGRSVSVKDFTIVCANCHRMLHRSPEFPSIEILRRRVRASRRTRVTAPTSTG